MVLESTPTLVTPQAAGLRDELVEAATALVADGAASPFVRDLFGRVAPDDLVPYSPGTLSALAIGAFDRLSRPRSGVSDVWLTDASVERDGRVREATIVEAINANAAHLLDSTLAELARRGLGADLVAHPILGVERDPSGTLLRVVGETTADARGDFPRESFIHVHVERIDDADARARLVEGLNGVYGDVASVSRDHDAMREALADTARALRAIGPEAHEAGEIAAFLDWIDDGRFTLLGTMAAPAGTSIAAGAPLGVLRGWSREALMRLADDGGPSSSARGCGISVTRLLTPSRVRRSARLDHVRISAPGLDRAGPLHVVGLFTGAAYGSPASMVPTLRLKVADVLARARLDPTSHAGRGLLSVLEGYPRDDLFQIEPDRLLRFALAIADLADRPRVKVLSRTDRTGLFASVIVYVFKDRYDSTVRARIGDHLARAYGGDLVDVQPDHPEGPLARIRFVIALPAAPGTPPEAGDLETAVAAIARTWGDELREALAGAFDGRGARVLADRYATAFSAGYRDRFSADEAIGDIATIEALDAAHPIAVDAGRRPADGPSRMRLQAFSRGAAIPLSDRVPPLENLGFVVIDERTYHVRPTGGDGPPRVWIHDMLLERATGAAIDLAILAAPLKEALLAMAERLTETDGYNRLVLEAGLGWRDAALMRALGRYLRQLRIRYGQDYLAATLAAHPALTRSIVALFHARFDPALAGDREGRQAAIRETIEVGLADVTSLDEDRILRRFVNLVEAAVRTNAFQKAEGGGPRETTSFKFACAKVAYMPLPRPFFEIFVYSPRVEGVHLRYGYVARGGLRWSDRLEDYRTEILGLVKAQQVKNAVIVPVGAKGGFLPKRLPPASERAAWLEEGTQSYRVFIRALLDLTDNLVGGVVVPPHDTVLHDGADAYLVVAADKGTATFSDIANGLSLERGHWLGDAFASGGSVGYDHKAMGITARGAWEAVRRHFAEMDVDVASDPVTVVGVGDMSGDVFGNGMLLSRSLRLVAAFDHRHVFLDPDPDPEMGFRERQRLFSLVRSGWDDYDRSLISRGGGVFARTLKAIPISPEVRVALGWDRTEASPAELIQAILRAPVDLLWFGGIGTYVRAGSEGDDEAGDRANDANRVTGSELRAKVVGEGANLGLTQRGRIEAARSGVALNTDAIDNSAGVNTSDVEVNIKIALMTPEGDGRLDAGSRSDLLAEMTDEVAVLVLRNNEQQTLALSLAQRRGIDGAASAMRVMRDLESAGRLDRAVEFLPSDVEIADRMKGGEGLTRPELSVLMAYVKLSLYDALLDSPIPDDPYFERELRRYFPARLRDRFPDAVSGHRLRREIVSTALANIIVNRGGPSLVNRLVEETGADAATIARAYAITRDVFGVMEMNLAIDGLAGRMRGREQLELYADVQDLLADRAVWFIRNSDRSADVEAVVELYRDGVASVLRSLPEVLDPSAHEPILAGAERLRSLGMADAPARMIAAFGTLAAAPDIGLAAQASGCTVASAASVYFAIERAFRLDAFEAAAKQVVPGDAYDGTALRNASSRISAAHRRLTCGVLVGFGEGAEAVAAWTAACGRPVARTLDMFREIPVSGLTVSKATVLAGMFSELGPAA